MWFVLDSSASMRQQSGDDVDSWSKFDYARHLLATLSYIGQRQGDHVGMLALAGKKQQLVLPGSGERHWHRLLRHLIQVECGGTFPETSLLKSAIERLQKNSLVFIISDFYQLSNEIHQFIKQISAGHNEVVALQLQCNDELHFPYKGAVRFEDLETGEQVLVSAASAREKWMRALADHQGKLDRFLQRHQVTLNRINIDEPMDQALYDFLISRQTVRH